ncbi:unnamed protein product [Effrenium voratum]|nr:unnamed protein product [Effrenium voratum]
MSDSGLQALSGYVQQVLGLVVGETEADAEPDFRGVACRGYTVVHGKRSCTGGLEPYHVDTTRNLTWKEREFLFAHRARDDVAEASPLDIGISRAAGQKFTHASSLVVEDASTDPVWLQMPQRSVQVPAMRWVHSAAAAVAERIQYTPADAPVMTGRSLVDFELYIPRGHIRYKQPGLPASTLHRHCRNEILPPLADVLRNAPLYVAAVSAGLICRVSVVAHPEGFEVIITDCESLTREVLVPFAHATASSSSSRFQKSLDDLLKDSLAEAFSHWIQEADAKGACGWELLWVTPTSATYLLACVEPCLRWPPHPDSIMLAAKAEIRLSPAAFSPALKQALQEVKEESKPARVTTGLFELADVEGDDSPMRRSPSKVLGRSASKAGGARSVQHSSTTVSWAQNPEEVEFPAVDVAKHQRYIAKVQDALAAELALAMGVQTEDVIVSSIEQDEDGNWKAVFSANATRQEMEAAMSGNRDESYPMKGPDQRVRRLAESMESGRISKDSRFQMLKHVDGNSQLNEIERLQITDALAWCRGLGGFTEEDTRRLAGIFLTPEVLHRKAYSGKGLQGQDLKRLREAGFTDHDLRRLGLLGYGLSEDEVSRLEQAGFKAEALQRRLLLGDVFTKEEQARLRTEGLPLERVRKLLAGTGKFSKSEKERLADVDLPESEVRRRLIMGEDFDEDELARLDSVDMPLYELRRRILQDELFSTEERLRLEVVGLEEADIQQRLADREKFSHDEMFSLESAGFDVEDLHRRVHGESCFSQTELQRLELIGMSEDRVVQQLLSGEEFSAEELHWLETGGFSLAKLTRRVFGTSNPTREDGELSRSFWMGPIEEEAPPLDNTSMAVAMQRLMTNQELLSEDEHKRLEMVGLPLEIMQQRLAAGEDFTADELQRLDSAGLSQSLRRLSTGLSDEDKQKLESYGLPMEEIERRIQEGGDFTAEEVDRLQTLGFDSVEDLQSFVIADSENRADDFEGEVIFKKSNKVRTPMAGPLTGELAVLLTERYISEEKSATTAMQGLCLEHLIGAARIAADDPTEVTLAELAKAIAAALRAEIGGQEIEEASELLQMLRAYYLLQLLEAAVESEDMSQLAVMLEAVDSKVKALGLLKKDSFSEEASGMLLSFYPRELDARPALQGLIQRAHAKQDKALAEAKLEEAMQHVAQCQLTNIIQIQQCSALLQEAMQRGEEAGASPVLLYTAEELLKDLKDRKARFDEFHAERIAAWHHLQQSTHTLYASVSQNLKDKKELQAALAKRSPKVPSGFKEELPVVTCTVSKSLSATLDHFLEIGLAATEDVQAETENLNELLTHVAGLNAFFQLPTPTDVFQLHDRKNDLAGLLPRFAELIGSASPPVGPIPALLKDCCRDAEKLLECWEKIVLEAMPKGLHQAILSGSSELVECCLFVCGDKSSVLAQVRDEYNGGAVHVAAKHGHWQVIEVVIANGADAHSANSIQQSALDVAIEALHKSNAEIDPDVELTRRLQETIDFLDRKHHVISYEYVKYQKRNVWFKRPETMLKWLRLKQLLEHHFENLKKAFLEIDTNHSGGIVKYEWEAMFGSEGQAKDALAAADLESHDVFGMLDGLDIEGKDLESACRWKLAIKPVSLGLIRMWQKGIAGQNHHRSHPKSVVTETIE